MRLRARPLTVDKLASLGELVYQDGHQGVVRTTFRQVSFGFRWQMNEDTYWTMPYSADGLAPPEGQEPHD